MTDPTPPTSGHRRVAERSRSGLPGTDHPHHLLEQAPVAPMDVDGFRVTVLGLVAFAVGCLVCAVYYDTLQRDGNGWWLGVCVSGFGLGLLGLAYCLYRRARRRAGRWDRD